MSVVVVGWVGDDPDDLSAHQRRALLAASRVVAARRTHPSLLGLGVAAELRAFPTPLSRLVDELVDGTVVVASGDPGFFGITRLLANVPELRVLPGPTSVGVAAARLGRSWDHASVVSFVGRDDDIALGVVAEGLRRPDPVVCLLRPGQPLGSLAALVAASRRASWLLVGLGTRGERVVASWWPSASTAPEEPSVLWVDGATLRDAARGRRAPGLDVFAERPQATDGVFSSLAVRLALVTRLGPESLPAGGRVLEVGAGSGYVGLALLRLRPDLVLCQLEPREERAANAEVNAAAFGHPRVEVRRERIQDHAVEVPYDAAIVGGGGLEALAAALARVRAGAPVVASFVDPTRAGRAGELLGHLELIEVARGVPTPPSGVRLVPATPVFVAWGPAPEAGHEGLAGLVER